MRIVISEGCRMTEHETHSFVNSRIFVVSKVQHPKHNARAQGDSSRDLWRYGEGAP